MANPSSDSVLPSRLEKNGSRELLLAFAIVCPLVVFSLPRVAVYDGERLYLMVFPLWGIFAGRGASALWFAASLRLKWLGRGAILAVWGAALWGLVAVAPCYLSYYNLLTGGLPGAAWLGLPVTCWGDSLTPAFLEEVAQNLPPDSTLQVAPVMEPLSQVKLLSDTPAFREKRLKLVPWHTSDSPWVLVFQREDYLDPDFRLPPKHLPVCQLRRRGVLLAALYRVR